MTVIVGIREQDKILLAADSCVTYSAHRDISHDKIFPCSGVWIGGAGDVDILQYVQFGVVVKPPGRMPLVEWCARRLAPQLREIYYNTRELDEEREPPSGEFLVAHANQMVIVTARGEVMGVTRDYTAIGGDGRAYAVGALHNSAGGAMERAKKAIHTAAEYCGDVAPPITYRWVK